MASTLKQQFASAVAFFATITSSFLCLNFCLGDEHHETYHREAHTQYTIFAHRTHTGASMGKCNAQIVTLSISLTHTNTHARTTVVSRRREFCKTRNNTNYAKSKISEEAMALQFTHIYKCEINVESLYGTVGGNDQRQLKN